MECNCLNELKIKDGHATIKSSPLITRPVNLSTLPPSDYASFAAVFPEAFELKTECDCAVGMKKKIKEEGLKSGATVKINGETYKNKCGCNGECICNKETKMEKAIREVKEYINKSIK